MSDDAPSATSTKHLVEGGAAVTTAVSASHATAAPPVEPTSTTYLGWRGDAVASPSVKRFDGSREQLHEAVHAALSSPALREPPPFITKMTSPPPDMSLVHTREQVEWYLRRMRVTNAVGGPRCRIVWSGTMKSLGRLPRWPDDAAHVLDAELLLTKWLDMCDDDARVDGREVCFTMFSHRWERPSLDPKLAHPDDEDNTKAKVLATYGELGACGVFPEHQFDYYVWLDFACIEQDDYPTLVEGVSMLPLYVSNCIELMFWDSPTIEYEPRAWTRVERMIAFAFCFSPLIVYVGPGYPQEEPDLDALVAKNTAFYDKGPDGKVTIKITDPLGPDASITNPADEELIAGLKKTCESSPPMNLFLLPQVQKEAGLDASWTFDDHPEEISKALSRFFTTATCGLDTHHAFVNPTPAVKKRRALVATFSAKLET